MAPLDILPCDASCKAKLDGPAMPYRRLTWFALAAVALAGCTGPRHDYRVVVIPKGMTHEFWQSIHRGAVRAASDLKASDGLDVDVIWDGPLRERDALAQIRIV